MGYLAAAGAYLIIGLVVSFILMVVGLFIGHIIVFDSIALGIISGVCCNHFFTLHPALCVLIGAAVFALLLRKAVEVDAALRSLGRIPVYKDWDTALTLPQC